MANFSIQELTDVLQKSGLPFGGSAQMQQAAPFAADPVRQTVMSSPDNNLPQISSSYKSQLDALAQMDKKLAGVYGDPNSPMYIEHAGRRDSAVYGHRATDQQAVNNIKQTYKDTQKGLESKATDALSLYTKLTTLQSREEARAKKLAKGSGKKSNSQKVQDSIDRANEAKSQKMSMAGLQDSDTIAAFDNIKEAGFRSWYLRSLQDAQLSGQGDIPPGGFSKQDIMDEYNWWKTNVNPPKAKSSGFDAKVKKLLGE